jgi:ABC-2 type transport system permease protein
MNTLLLLLISRLNPVWRAFGADPGQVLAIVRVKLLMDNRRKYATLGRAAQKKDDEISNSFVWVLGTYALFGAFISVGILAVLPAHAILPGMGIEIAYVMVFCAMTLISDFSSLVLDAADNQIILPRPVSGRTLLLARIVHIASYLLLISVALSVVGLGIIVVRFGPVAGLMFLVMVLLSALLMVFLTNVFYLLLMQFLREDRLREVINYFQIVMALVFYGGLQLMPRLMNYDALGRSETVSIDTWHYFVPPMWMAGAVDMVIQQAYDGPHLLLTGLAVTMPFIGLWVMNRFLAPVFNRRLAGLEEVSNSAPSAGIRQALAPSTVAATLRPLGLMQQIARLVTRTPLEKAGFGFAWRITARDRQFKLKTYPQLGFGLVYVVAMTINKSGMAAMGGFYVFALYYTGLFLMTAQYQLSVSDNYKAGWLYGSTPIAQPGELLLGAMKALIIKLMVPFYTLVAVYILYKYGLDKIGDVLLAFSNSLVMSLLSAMMVSRYLPFSMPQDAVNRSNTARGLRVIVVLGLIGGAHYGLTWIPFGVWIGLPVSLGAVWYLLNRYRQTTWAEIRLD